MPRIPKVPVKFIVSFIAMSIVCEVAWEYTAANLYDDTDENMLGFFQPLMWPHPWVQPFNGNSVVVVHQIIHGRSMSEPDEIKEGWTVGRLWGLWFSFVAVALISSIALARIRWVPKWHEKPARLPESAR